MTDDATQSLDDAATVQLPAYSPKAGSDDGATDAALTLWKSPDGLLETGVWECTPGSFPSARDGYDEVFHTISGRATIVDSHGVSTEVTPGTVFVTPSGWHGTWTVHETFRKTYVIRHHA